MDHQILDIAYLYYKLLQRQIFLFLSTVTTVTVFTNVTNVYTGVISQDVKRLKKSDAYPLYFGFS